MKKVLKTIIKIALVILALSIVCFGILMYIFVDGMTGTSVTKSIKSPDGKYIAYAFIRNSGATSKETYNISILKDGQSLGKGTGNIFVTYNTIDMNWDNSKKLVIKYVGNYEIFKNESKYKDIGIEYVPTSALK